MENIKTLLVLSIILMSAELHSQEISSINENATSVTETTGSLQDTTLFLKEASVFAERLKGKIENDRTIYFVTDKIVAASGSAQDVLRYIPGIQVDLKKNISLEGSSNVLLFVNGMERDKSYISQLNPSNIDRVEVLNTPSSNYDGNVSGVINIILKKDGDMGFSGSFFTEIPTSGTIVYSFPTYNIQYAHKNLNLYTSYNGEINFEDIDEIYKYQIRETSQTDNITYIEQVRQKNLSHKFHYGLDYYATSKDVFSYYGSINPYSYEKSGKVLTEVNGDDNTSWGTQREETDKNLNVFNSLYYKRLFNKEGREVVIDISNSILRSNNSISFLNEEEPNTHSVINSEKPRQVSTNIKIDFSNPIGENLMLNTGVKAGNKSMQNENIAGFDYNENLYAIYGFFHYKRARYNLNFGARAEYVQTELKSNFNKNKLSVLPYATFQYRLSKKHNFLLSYRHSVNRPSIFQLTPYTYFDNEFSVRKGNPLLEPEFRQRLYAEHSIRYDVSYISYRIFYERRTNAINNLTVLNEGAGFETQLQNLGEISQLGIQFSGSLKLGSLAITPLFILYNQSTFGNNLAKQNNIDNRNNWAFEAGISTVMSFKHDFALSGTLQYSTAKNYIQDNAFSDALYLLSLDKTFKNNFKLGIVAALPFAKTFIYQATEIEAQNYTNSYSGTLKLPTIPIMFRLNYQFRIGKDKALLYREIEEAPKRQRKGF